MSIQFQCPSCGKQIEVDDQHARQTAACCYCGNSATVPEQSTIGPDAIVSARPVETAPVALESLRGVLPPVPLDQRQRMSELYGNLGLLCAGIMTFLVLLIAFYMAPQWKLKFAQSGSGSQPSLQEVERVMQSTPGMNYVTGASCGALLFGIVGVSLAIVALAQNSRGWRGWLALTLCGGYLTCNCASAVLVVLGGMK